MTGLPSRQHGLTLIELLGALAIAAVLMVPLAALFQDAAETDVAGRTALDLNADLRFALDRIATEVSALAQPALPPGGADVPPVSAWLSPLSYTLSTTPTGTNLVETDTTPKTGQTSIIAANVSAFKLSAPDMAAGQPLVQVDLTLSANGVSVSGTRTVRLGGPQ
jgi:prepilin-type N-terminal cleavage/methylation domain-containing protein